jgi:hypothetical protein
MSDHQRPYWLAVTVSVFRALFWPDGWWNKAWHGVIILGAAFAPELRESLEMTLAGWGVTGLENWHYYVVAAALAILTLGIELARLTTARVTLGGLRYTIDNYHYYVKIGATNRSARDCLIYVQLRLFDQATGVALTHENRDAFVLLTQQRAAERGVAKYDPSMRRRFHLGAREQKDLELLRVETSLQHATLIEELGDISTPLKNYLLELIVYGGAAPWRGTITMDLPTADAVIFETTFEPKATRFV